jgi:hypothetical protein
MSEMTIKGDFNDFMYDPIEREEALQSRLNEYYNLQIPMKETYSLQFMNKDFVLPVINVPIELLMYRLENGRTVSLQDEHLAQHPDLPDDFFSRDDNSPEAQTIQHELLMKLCMEKDRDKIIFTLFKDTNNKQIDPLIITNKGFVVNGNRRLSCWRTLYFSDKKVYKHFEYIKVAVLPLADEKAIDKLEADLQIAPDIKADYSWHAEAKMMKRRKDERMEKIEDIAKFYRIKEKDVEERIEMLWYAGEYLKRNNWDRQWSRLDQDYYAFEQLVKNRKNLSYTVDKSLLESITYAYITTSKGDEGVEGRLYGKIPEIRRYLNPIVEAIGNEIPDIKNDPKQIDVDLLSDELFDTPNDLVEIALALVNTSEEVQKKVVEISEQVIADEKAKEREKKSTNYLLEQVKKANSSLENAKSAIDDYVMTTGLMNILISIEKKVSYIKEWLEKHESNN